MTWTLSDSGTTSALTLGTETVLATDTNNGTFVLEVDTSNMVAGDMLEARIYTITLSGGSLIQAWKGTWWGPQINNHKISLPVASDQSVKCTLKQIGGTITITSVTGTVPDQVIGTGQTTAATAIICPPGGAGFTSGTSTIVKMTSGAFNSSEIVWCTTSTNEFTMNAAPTGRTFPWKMLRV